MLAVLDHQERLLGEILGAAEVKTVEVLPFERLPFEGILPVFGECYRETVCGSNQCYLRARLRRGDVFLSVALIVRGGFFGAGAVQQERAAE